MNSFTPKPYNAPGKHSSLPRVGAQTKDVKEKTNTLPMQGVPLSGDILKQRIASMHHTKPFQQGKGSIPTPKPSSSSGAKGGPVITENELKWRRDSMHRTPPPPTPDCKPNFNKTPEFQRKKLRPTAVPENEAKKSDSNKENDNSEMDDVKKTFRNSRLMFENISAAPKIAPKPKSRSLKSKEPPPIVPARVDTEEIENTAKVPKDNNLSEDTATVETPIETISIPVIPDGTSSSVGTGEDVQSNEEASRESKVMPEKVDVSNDLAHEETNLKPKDVTMPEIPTGLDAWMNRFVRSNANLKVVDADAAPPLINRDLKRPMIAEITPSVEEGHQINTEGAHEEEVYDDVDTSASQGDSGVKNKATDEGEELYDDVNVPAPDQNDTGVEQDDVYDDVAGGITQGFDEKNAGDGELYDDVVGANESQEIYDDVAPTEQQEQELYDDVQTEAASHNGFANENDGTQEEPAMYEPVETIQQYMISDGATNDEADGVAQAVNRSSKRKEEKEKKEKGKLDKKRKEEAEKKMKKEEEERKKREKEERKRLAKERKLFNLKPDEDPVPIERHMAICDVKGKGKDLPITQGEYLDVISKHNCPKGKVLVQNKHGKLGYVLVKDLGIDKRKSLIESRSPVAAGVAFGEIKEEYEDVCTSTSLSSTAIISLSSVSPVDDVTTVPKFSHFSKPSPKKVTNRQENLQKEETTNQETGDIYEVI